MNKISFFILALFAFNFGYAQKDKTYYSLEKALKNPELVFRLSLSSKGLSSIPERIGELYNLKELNLERNQLTTLPQSIGKLINLEIIYLGNNNIVELPETFTQLTKLKEISFGYRSQFVDERGVFGNPLKVIPDLNKSDSLELISIIGCKNIKISDLKILKQPNLRFEWTKNQAANRVEFKKYKKNRTSGWLRVYESRPPEKRLKIQGYYSYLNK